MTLEIKHPAWVDALDRKLIDAFPGRVVRKDLVQRLKVGFSIPVYVLEYLLGKYCSTTDESQIDSGLANVKEMIKERIVRSDQSELIKARLQRFRSMKMIDMVTVTFDEKDQGGKYWAKFATSGLDKVHIDERIVYQYERTLTGGVWANLELAFDETIVHGGVTRPFVLKRMQPIQIASANLDEYAKARRQFTREEWVGVLMRTVGYEPSSTGVHMAAKAPVPSPTRADGRAQLQPHRTRPQGNREVVCLSRNLSLRHSPFRRPGQRDRPVRLEEPQGQAGTCGEIRSCRIRRSCRPQLQVRE